MATSTRERILLVDDDPDSVDLIAKQVLVPIGYQVRFVSQVSEALEVLQRFAPQLILARLHLPDLSGKDLLVALRSQKSDIPVILIGFDGEDQDIIHSFRLGAADYLTTPLREAELVIAVERALMITRARQERDQMEMQLLRATEELQRRTKEFSAVYEIGREFASVKNPKTLTQKIVDGAVKVSRADLGWLLLRSERNKQMVLAAYRNLPEALNRRLNRPWDDGVSSIVAMSGEPLAIAGLSLRQFPVSRLGQSLCVVPVRVQREIIGLIGVMRSKPKSFDQSTQDYLIGLSSYAAAALMNVRLFQALDQRKRS